MQETFLKIGREAFQNTFNPVLLLQVWAAAKVGACHPEARTSQLNEGCGSSVSCVWLRHAESKSLRQQNVHISSSWSRKCGDRPALLSVRGRAEEKRQKRQFIRLEGLCSFIFLVWPSSGLISCFLPNGLGMAAARGWRVALAGGQITGLGCYHGFWNMALRVLHVLATGAGTCDVVADMWKLSSVYPAQPSSVPLSKEVWLLSVRAVKPFC